MDQWQPLRILIVCHQHTFARVLMTNIQCWGYEAVMHPATVAVGRDGAKDLEGDILLYDLDEVLSPLMVEKDTSTVQRGLPVSGLVGSREGQWPRTRLTIALSSRSVSRSTLERVGAVALLQKPFEMGQLQRYLKVLERLLHYDECKDTQLQFNIHNGNRRVLVVDDDVDITQTIQQCLLSEVGYEVAVAHDGLEALEQCLDWHPQCVVTD